MPRQRAAVLRLHSEVTYEDLKRIESTEERRTDTPKALPRSAIIVADKVFQWRQPEEDMQGSEEHVRTLVREIGTGKERKPLDLVLVTAVGQAFYLVDGHHRMEAYHTAKWAAPIPVEVFKGSLRDARDEAFSRNYKDKLPMTPEAKLEAAWVRFNEGDLSWSELEERFRVSNGTIARMSKARKALLEAKQNPAEVRWRDARSPASLRNSNDGGTSIADHSRVFKFIGAENLVDLQTNRFCSPYFVHESARFPRSSQSLGTQGLIIGKILFFLDFTMQQRCISPSDNQSNDIAHSLTVAMN